MEEVDLPEEIVVKARQDFRQAVREHLPKAIKTEWLSNAEERFHQARIQPDFTNHRKVEWLRQGIEDMRQVKKKQEAMKEGFRKAIELVYSQAMIADSAKQAVKEGVRKALEDVCKAIEEEDFTRAVKLEALKQYVHEAVEDFSNAKREEHMSKTMDEKADGNTIWRGCFVSEAIPTEVDSQFVTMKVENIFSSPKRPLERPLKRPKTDKAHKIYSIFTVNPDGRLTIGTNEQEKRKIYKKARRFYKAKESELFTCTSWCYSCTLKPGDVCQECGEETPPYNWNCDYGAECYACGSLEHFTPFCPNEEKLRLYREGPY